MGSAPEIGHGRADERKNGPSVKRNERGEAEKGWWVVFEVCASRRAENSVQKLAKAELQFPFDTVSKQSFFDIFRS